MKLTMQTRLSQTTIALIATVALCVPQVGFAQRAGAKKTGTKSTARAVAPVSIKLGERPKIGEPCEFGKTYLVGIGDHQINLKIDKAEVVGEYTHLDTTGKPKTEKIENDIHAWLIVRFTTQNVGKTRLPIWEETWTNDNKPRLPYVQMNAVREYKAESDGSDSADYFELYEKDFYRAEDGKILDTTGSDDAKNWLMPGQTVKAFAVFQVRKEAEPIVTHLQVNYFVLPTGGGVGVGDPRMADEKSKSTLMTFDLRKALNSAGK